MFYQFLLPIADTFVTPTVLRQILISKTSQNNQEAIILWCSLGLGKSGP